MPATGRRLASSFAVAACMVLVQFRCVHVMLHSSSSDGNWFSSAQVVATFVLCLASGIGAVLIFRVLQVTHWLAWGVLLLLAQAITIFGILGHVPSHHGDIRFVSCIAPVVICVCLAERIVTRRSA
ncbi:hypothetical protein SAMN05444157_1074 [Frankineae bacterium MT45]|nr:hypothetical protein SAMN05444157_1074 [Frankineae bacterium MT45]